MRRLRHLLCGVALLAMALVTWRARDADFSGGEAHSGAAREVRSGTPRAPPASAGETDTRESGGGAQAKAQGARGALEARSARAARVSAAPRNGDGAVTARDRLEQIAALADPGRTSVDLAQALGDVSPAVRYEAVYALGESGDPSNALLLRQALMDPDRNVREAAIDAFAAVGGDLAARSLGVMLHDSDAELREEAVYALAEIGGAAAAELLEQACLDSDRNVRAAAADLLADRASPRE
jgi:hypothetical protein